MRHHFIAAAGMAALWIVTAFPAPAEAAERMNANVHLNKEIKGNFPVTITDDGKIFFARKDLLRLGIKELPSDTTTGTDGYVSLSPHVHAEFDQEAAILHLSVEPNLLENRASDNSHTKIGERVHTQVHLNGDDKGKFLITLTDEGKILFARKDLMLLGINALPSSTAPGEDGYISLSPQVRAEFDKQALMVRLSVAPGLLDKPATSSASLALPTPTLAPVPLSAPTTTFFENAIANVQVNLEDKGDFIFMRSNTGRILIAQEDMPRLGIKNITTDSSTGANGYVPLAPYVHVNFDEIKSILHLTVDPEYLGKTSIDLARKQPERAFVQEATTGFINYGLSYSVDEDSEFSSLSMPLETGITSSGYLGVSSFSYFKDVTNERFVRLMTSVVRDDPPKRTRITAGDFSSSSGMLGSGGLFGGLSIATNFSLDPYSLRYPGANLYGAVNTPSDVEVYINGLLVGKSHLSPGEFEFLNIGSVQGSGEATMVIKDASGKMETFTVPYYTSTQLLKPGLQDFNYGLGYQREAFGQESNEYGDAAFLGYHRVGISEALTGGLRAEADANVANGGANVTFLVGTLGEFDLSAAYSRDDGGNGSGWAARYSRASRYMSVGLFARGFSRDYSNLMVTSSDDKAHLEASGNIGFRQNFLGSFSLFYSKKDMYADTDRKRYGINYNRRLASQVSLNIIAARTVAETTTNEFFANLMIYLGKARSATASYQKIGNETAERVSLQQSAPLGTGFGYRLIADRKDNDQSDPVYGGDAYLQYRGNHGVYSAEHRIFNDSRTSTLGTTGGIAFINSSAYFTRPIYDGFVLAKVGTLENVVVSYNNQEVGMTDRHGEILIPEMKSYHRNTISINDKNIPVNFELTDTNRSLSTPYRAGGMVNFDTKKLQGFTGRLFISEHGKKIAAEYWGLRITLGTEAREVIVGKKGEFYLENLPAGRFSARLFSKDRSCAFALSIPDSEDTMVDMGDVICEKN